MALVLNKKYKLASSENFDEVMKALGKDAITFVCIFCSVLIIVELFDVDTGFWTESRKKSWKL
jgi:hypothetical protein